VAVDRWSYTVHVTGWTRDGHGSGRVEISEMHYVNFAVFMMRLNGKLYVRACAVIYQKYNKSFATAYTKKAPLEAATHERRFLRAFLQRPWAYCALAMLMKKTRFTIEQSKIQQSMRRHSRTVIIFIDCHTHLNRRRLCCWIYCRETAHHSDMQNVYVFSFIRSYGSLIEYRPTPDDSCKHHTVQCYTIQYSVKLCLKQS